jgi:acyl carrier protein
VTEVVMEIGTKIRRYIAEELLFGEDERAIKDDTPLCDGVIDSMGLMDLMTFIEAEFGIEIDEHDLTSDNFKDVASIESMIARRVE